MVLHDAQDLLVGDLPEILDGHESGAERRQQDPEPGDELVGGFEILQLHLVDLLGDGRWILRFRHV